MLLYAYGVDIAKIRLKNNEIIRRSTHNMIENTIVLEYNKLIFVSIPDCDIFITFDSLKDAINSLKE